MSETLSTNLLVAARGQVIGGETWQLGDSSIKRVNTAVGYYRENQVAFSEALAEERGGLLE